MLIIVFFIDKHVQLIFFRYKLFPPKVRLLTEDEYIRQGSIETTKELEKLRDYCRSPQCQAWKIISKLKTPQR